MNDTSVLPADADPDTFAETIRVRGARVHNLQNIDVDLPREQLIVITGPSGSGKSSLAFDTLFAEGQRQYIESLSVYARQFLHQMERPDVDLVEGLQPTISIDQRAGSQNPRSTVATVTEIYDYLRLLFARLATPHCYECGAAIRQRHPDEIVEDLLLLPEGTKLLLLAPLVRGRKGQHKEVFATIRKAGLLRARVNGEVVDAEHPPELSPRKNHTIEAVIDRIVIRPGVNERLTESVDLAVKQGEGTMIASYASKADDGAAPAWEDDLYSTLFACPNCRISFEELEPRTFSFNSPYGACPACEGLGVKTEFDPDLFAPDRTRPLDATGILPWKGLSPAHVERYLKPAAAFLAEHKVDPAAPLEQLSPKLWQQLLRGDGAGFSGLITLLEQQYVTETDAAERQRLELFRGEVPCPVCGGARLRAEARHALLDGHAIHHVTALNVSAARAFLSGMKFDDADQPIAEPILRELLARLGFLEKVGLNYLTLDRGADTLSGGELQRVRLATGIGSGLVGVCYILDEPSIGLHPRDNARLIEALRDLQQGGNTVLVVEHDEAMMREADRLIDIGPGAGKLGGRIVSHGTPKEVAADPASLTGAFLSGREQIAVPATRRKTTKTRSITLEGATLHNLKNVDVRFPLGALVCVTGVSGSGKSSLLNGTFAKALARKLNGAGAKPGPHTSLRGVNQIDKLIQIDQSPIGRTPRSNPATYTGLWDEIRKVFASTKEAKARGFKSGRFSFNIKGGRCEECQGQGLRKIEMNFLPDLYVTCPICHGQRFNQQTLEIRYRDQSIADVLAMEIDDATTFFENFPAIRRVLVSLQQVGLGYLTLGQASTTLSGGEAQRIKLATELSRTDTGSTLYLLDEPTTGLHFEDIRKLLEVLQRLVDLGNTVIVIEHNLDVIKSADHLIDLGPEGGAGGGRILATGTPEEIAGIEGNSTGKYLREVLGQERARLLKLERE